MLPGMVDGFNKFLATKGTTLRDIKKIEFKEIVTSDLVYTVLPTKDMQLQKGSNINGIFSDDTWADYYFYAQDIAKFDLKRSNRDNCLHSFLLAHLLLEAKEKISDLNKKIMPMWEHIEYPLLKLEEDQEKEILYKESMMQNTWYIIWLVADLVSAICSTNVTTQWFVSRYENVQRDKDLNIESFFDGSMKLIVQQKGTPRIIKDNTILNYDFVLKDGDSDVVSWSVWFRLLPKL